MSPWVVRALVPILVSAVLAPATLLDAAPQQREPVSVDRAGLMRDVATLASDAMEGREVGTPGGLRARAYVEARFQESGLREFEGGYVRSFPLPSRSERTTADSGANVVGYIAGTERPDRFVVVSAHYDHVGVRNGRSSTAPTTTPRAPPRSSRSPRTSRVSRRGRRSSSWPSTARSRGSGDHAHSSATRLWTGLPSR